MKSISIFFVVSGVLLSLFVYSDTKKHKQAMPIMGIVWPLTMLWASWLGLLAYLLFGRAKKTGVVMDDTSVKIYLPSISYKRKSIRGASDKSMPMSEAPMADMSSKSDTMTMDSMQAKPKWQGIALSTLHCGAGCVLADIIGESIAGILGIHLVAGWILDYILAFAFGVYFQYMAIQQMGNVTLKLAFNKAIKSDLLSLTAWQVGMYGFMSIYIFYYAENVVNRASFEFWYVMQLAMLVGFFVSYPMNAFMIKKGLKHAM